jgi:ABC-type lipoprotein release transport system permease subunit
MHRDSLLMVILILIFSAVLLTIPSLADGGERSDASLIEVAITRRTAEHLGLREGDIVEIGADATMNESRRARIAVVWSPREHPADVARGTEVLLHLPDLESLLSRQDTDHHDTVNRVVIRLRDPSLAQAVKSDLESAGAGYDAYTAADLASRSSRPFVVISQFHRAIGIVTLIAGGIFLVTVMALKLMEMRREVGALRLIGIGASTIGLTVMLIAGAAALLGTAVGIGLGMGLVSGINAYYRPLFETTLDFAVMTPETILVSAGLALLLGLAAGVAVLVQFMRRHPLEQVGR